MLVRCRTDIVVRCWQESLLVLCGRTGTMRVLSCRLSDFSGRMVQEARDGGRVPAEQQFVDVQMLLHGLPLAAIRANEGSEGTAEVPHCISDVV